ncbi:unnamed protein product [Hymenolepis diminuta]|uniref:Uncharacterized protein n=1 Tax=Hymenolepis diminuta TaxID=6216 RepID=A0A564YG07_HYMDI|nr:unnamed protein product [Hymenolepis diminuta]
MSAQEIKCVVVGDGVVGKTCLLTVQVFDTYRANCKIGDKECIFSLTDTAGQEGYENLRKFTYPGTSVFLVCYSVDNRASYDNIRAKWVPDIRENNPTTPIVLVACKTDLRSSTPNCLSVSDGQNLAHEIHAVDFIECSALMNANWRQTGI